VSNELGATGAAERWRSALLEAAALAVDSIRLQTARSVLAIIGLIIGIVTVVLVSSTLVGLRNSVAQLFRELGTDNIFAFHRAGDPYSPASDADAGRRTLTPPMPRPSCAWARPYEISACNSSSRQSPQPARLRLAPEVLSRTAC
jgi:hypothetical protein